MSTNVTDGITYERGTNSTTNTSRYPGQPTNVSYSAGTAILWKITTNRRTIGTPHFLSPPPLRPNPLPFNPFSYFKIEEKRGVGSFFRSYTDNSRLYVTSSFSGNSGTLPDFNPRSVPTSEEASLNDFLNKKILQKVKDQKVNLFQAMAERAQAARTVGDLITNLAQAFGAAKRGNFKSAAKHLGINPMAHKDGRKRNAKSLSKGWLALQYGWKPLLSDVFGAAEALAKARLDTPPRERVAIWGGRQSKVVETYDRVSATRTCTFDSNLQKCMVCLFKADDQNLKTLSELGITNPATVAWELLPWSFVVDWFIPIGNYINSWDATLGVTFVGGSITTKQENRSHQIDVFKPYGIYTVHQGLDVSSITHHKTDRVLLTGFPSPVMPVFKNPFSMVHLANATALLRANFRK